jgi:hypothetical protein
MPLLQSTFFAAVFLIPGVLSLAFALAPRGPAFRHSSVPTRAFGLVFFSVADWALALLLYHVLVRNCGATLAVLLYGEDKPKREALASLMTFPPALWIGLGLMVCAIIFTGGLVGAFHSAALTGMAIHDFRLQAKLPRCPHSHLFAWKLAVCGRCRQRTWVTIAQRIDSLLRFFGLTSVFQPLGAGYWLVILRAARVLQWSSPDDAAEGRVARVYADVVQGDEVLQDGKIVGTLYKGTVKHLVCETDGNIVFLLLEQPSRWRGHQADEGGKDIVVPGHEVRERRSPWKQIEKSAAFALEGKSIRNISFRLVDKPFSVPVNSEEAWKVTEDIDSPREQAPKAPRKQSRR